MIRTMTFTLSAEEARAVLNALNYFGYGIGPGECHTLLGCEQLQIRALFERIRSPDGDVGPE
jgi:hypothetical protein